MEEEEVEEEEAKCEAVSSSSRWSVGGAESKGDDALSRLSIRGGVRVCDCACVRVYVCVRV